MNKKPIVKVCGLTRHENILEVIQSGADWIGFIFYAGSPRFLADPGRLNLTEDETSGVKKIGVFVNAEMEEVDRVCDEIRLDGLQFHGDESPDFCSVWKRRDYLVIKAFGLHPEFSFSSLKDYEGVADYLLFDTAVPSHGGSGVKFDWNLVHRYEGNTPFLLSGGISPETHEFPEHPAMAGVDLNSRFELAPGLKDAHTLKQFISRYKQ